MTEKQFTIADVYDMSANEIADLLNEQHETITEQQIQLDFLQSENKHMREILEENKQLKKDKQQLYRTESRLRVRIKQLEELNKKLDEEMKYCKRELQKELVCQAIIDGREKNE